MKITFIPKIFVTSLTTMREVIFISSRRYLYHTTMRTSKENWHMGLNLALDERLYIILYFQKKPN